MSDGVIATRWEAKAPEEWCRAWRIPALVILESTPSSNDVAMRLAAGGSPAGTTVIAERQTRGRGREGRSWSDSSGMSLLMSVVLRSDAAVDPSTVPLRTGLAVARAIEDLTGIAMRIKWPNDILSIDGRKIGGILCEGASGGTSAWLVAGIGLNVSQTSTDFDADVRETATALAMIGATVDRPALAGRILDRLRPFRIEPPPLDQAMLRALEERDALRGRQVTLNGNVACTADGIAPDGALRTRRHGELHYVRSGTVRIAPAAGAPAQSSPPRH